MPDTPETNQNAIESEDPLAEYRRRGQHEGDILDRDVRFFSIATLAKRWGVSPSTVRSIGRLDLPWLNLGRGRKREVRRFRPEDVEAYEARELPKRPSSERVRDTAARSAVAAAQELARQWRTEARTLRRSAPAGRIMAEHLDHVADELERVLQAAEPRR